MTLREYYDRFASCPKDGTGQPCPECDAARSVLDALVARLPKWETYIEHVMSDDPDMAAPDYAQLAAASDACIRVAIYCWMMAATLTDDTTGEPMKPRATIWVERFAASLHREVGRQRLQAEIAVVPTLNVLLFQDDHSDRKSACVCGHGHHQHYNDVMGTRCSLSGCPCREFVVDDPIKH